MATFELKRNELRQFYFGLMSEDQKTILRSEQYTSKASAQHGIESVRKNADVNERYELKENISGKFYFNLKAVNGLIIGSSSMYASAQLRDDAVAELKKNAKMAGVVEDV